MARLRFSPVAERDLEKISDDIAAAAGERVAVRFMRRLKASLRNLEDFPRMGRPRPRIGAGVRSWAFPPYVAFYQLSEDAVEIIRLVHGRRRITRKLVRSD